MHRLLFIFCILFSLRLSSQSFEKEIKESLRENPKVDLRFDSRHSFVNQSGIKVFGIKAGIQYAKKLSFGIGYNVLWEPLARDFNRNGINYNVELAFYNISPYVEYVFFRDKRWELSIPVQIGFGSAFYRNKEDSGPVNFNKKFVLSYEPAITFQYRFLKYFGAGLGIGYRLMIIPNNSIEEKFTSPVYIFKTNIYFEDIYKDILGK